MIDFYDIENRFIQLGPDEWERLPGHGKRNPPANRAHIRLSPPNWMGMQEALIFQDHFRLRVCPAKVLGRWNTYGSNDLRRVIERTAPLMLEAMGITVTPRIRQHFADGDYRIREVHIAEQFHLPNHGCTDFLTQSRRRLDESHNVKRIERGRGFKINPGSRRCESIFYNKLFEFHNKALPQYQRLIAVEPRSIAAMGHMVDRDIQQHLAALGPRLEFRLGDHFFSPSNPLSQGSGWRRGREQADQIYCDQLKLLNLPGWVRASWARRTAEHRLSRAELATYLLWHYGEPLSVAAGSPKTVTRHAGAIRSAIGVDIRQPASAALKGRNKVDLGAVFAWRNRVRRQEVELDRDLGRLNEWERPLG